MLESLLLVSSLCIDSFVASIAYGTSKIKIPPKSVIIINLVCTSTLACSLFIGSLFKGDDYVLSFNGGIVINSKTEEIITSSLLKGSDLKEIFKTAKELDINIHAFSVKEGLITPKMSQYTQHECDINGIKATIKDFNEIEDDEDIVKVMMIDPQEKLDEAIKKLPKDLYEKYSVFKSAPFFLEFTNKEVDKGKGLKKLGEYLGIKQDEIIACGDAGNDLSMVEYAGLGVAMENATDDVKKAANYITLSNDEDGIVHVVEKFILN